jgi:hypothetical protein
MSKVKHCAERHLTPQELEDFCAQKTIGNPEFKWIDSHLDYCSACSLAMAQTVRRLWREEHQAGLN